MPLGFTEWDILTPFEWQMNLMQAATWEGLVAREGQRHAMNEVHRCFGVQRLMPVVNRTRLLLVSLVTGTICGQTPAPPAPPAPPHTFPLLSFVHAVPFA